MTINRSEAAGRYKETVFYGTCGWLTMSKRSWIVDLESFYVLASDEDEAIEEGHKWIRENGVRIDQVLEDPFSPEYDDSGNAIGPRKSLKRTR